MVQFEQNLQESGKLNVQDKLFRTSVVSPAIATNINYAKISTASGIIRKQEDVPKLLVWLAKEGRKDEKGVIN